MVVIKSASKGFVGAQKITCCNSLIPYFCFLHLSMWSRSSASDSFQGASVNLQPSNENSEE